MMVWVVNGRKMEVPSRLSGGYSGCTGRAVSFLPRSVRAFAQAANSHEVM